jgi:2-polyprenyl-3-methyl-5-hydroxy-6-metoxy-1,4-benzoquinol methylase
MTDTTTTNRAWQKWGAQEPYFAVLSDAKFRGDQLAGNLDEFFASGERYIASRLAAAERLYGPLKTGHALDFGCGVARLVMPLARRFDAVTGIDISPAMLREAAANLAKAGLTNAKLIESDVRPGNLDQTFHFVHSYIVLQHIPVARGMEIIRDLLRVTAPDGVVSLQITLSRRDSTFGKIAYRARRSLPGGYILANIARGRRWNEPEVQMNEYNFAEVMQLFQEAGFGQAMVDFETQGRLVSVNLMARRTSGATETSHAHPVTSPSA